MREATSWSYEEDTLLVGLRNIGWSFDAIAYRLPNRTATACRSRFSGLKTGKLMSTVPDPEPTEVVPLWDSSYVFRVPEGDPYLQRLIQFHGNDKIDRDVHLKKKVA